MCRRYFTDEKDFAELDFDRKQVDNFDGADCDLINDCNSCLEDLETMWRALGVDTEFETILRWENTMSKKAESENDKVNND